MKSKIKNERGDMSFFSIFIILAINMLLSFVLLNASVQINCINIRNAAKMELNNVSARIYADTFHSQREANLTSYMADINLSTAYKNALRAGFIEGMKSRVKLTNDDYDVENIDLNTLINFSFGTESKRIFIIDNVMLDKYSFGSRPSELQLLT